MGQFIDKDTNKLLRLPCGCSNIVWKAELHGFLCNMHGNLVEVDSSSIYEYVPDDVITNLGYELPRKESK